MKKVIAFHLNQSSGIGGIESLYRSFIKLSSNLNMQFHEIFVNNFNESSNPAKNNLHVLHKINAASIFPRMILSLWRYYRLKGIISDIGVSSEDIVLFISTSPLIFLNKKLLNNSRVVLIQSNKVSRVFMSKMSRLIFYLKRDIITNLVVYTEYDRNVLLRSLPFFEKKVIVIPRGCRLITRSTISNCGKKLVAIARIEEKQKNFYSMVRIMELLPKEYSLDIYGVGSDDEIRELRIMISPLSNIQFRGPAHDVASCLAEYSIFLMTSHYEGFGQSLIEARSQGLPTVVFDTFEALPEVVSHCVTGFIVPYMEHKSFAERIIELSESPEKYKVFSTNSLKFSANNELSLINKKWSQLFLNN